MMNLGPHVAFILGSYLACAAIVIVLTAWIIVDNSARKRELALAEARRKLDAHR